MKLFFAEICHGVKELLLILLQILELLSVLDILDYFLHQFHVTVILIVLLDYRPIFFLFLPDRIKYVVNFLLIHPINLLFRLHLEQRRRLFNCQHFGYGRLFGESGCVLQALCHLIVVDHFVSGALKKDV